VPLYLCTFVNLGAISDVASSPDIFHQCQVYALAKHIQKTLFCTLSDIAQGIIELAKYMSSIVFPHFFTFEEGGGREGWWLPLLLRRRCVVAQ
jgi:hypothetical protein